ncbi:MAG TPA: SusD/RagB family nutrient-binding outer membrane lipoprotein, partial [Porphyromonadaceae bacterium]|nr:SusD/RagB family nutrient-binding outer membrane lipoprotein [Porphyromonadaceae bacterium]
GIPSRSSSIYAWTDHGADKPLPRRMEINNPSPSDLMGPNINAAAERQGFTLGTNDPFILNAQRVWIDKNAPNFGDGPNFK